MDDGVYYQEGRYFTSNFAQSPHRYGDGGQNPDGQASLIDLTLYEVSSGRLDDKEVRSPEQGDPGFANRGRKIEYQVGFDVDSEPIRLWDDVEGIQAVWQQELPLRLDQMSANRKYKQAIERLEAARRRSFERNLDNRESSAAQASTGLTAWGPAINQDEPLAIDTEILTSKHERLVQMSLEYRKHLAKQEIIHLEGDADSEKGYDHMSEVREDVKEIQEFAVKTQQNRVPSWRRLFIDTSAMEEAFDNQEHIRKDAPSAFESAFSYEFKKTRNDIDEQSVIILDDILQEEDGKPVAQTDMPHGKHQNLYQPNEQQLPLAHSIASMQRNLQSDVMSRQQQQQHFLQQPKQQRNQETIQSQTLLSLQEDDKVVPRTPFARSAALRQGRLRRVIEDSIETSGPAIVNYWNVEKLESIRNSVRWIRKNPLQGKQSWSPARDPINSSGIALSQTTQTASSVNLERQQRHLSRSQFLVASDAFRTSSDEVSDGEEETTEDKLIEAGVSGSKSRSCEYHEQNSSLVSKAVLQQRPLPNADAILTIIRNRRANASMRKNADAPKPEITANVVPSDAVVTGELDVNAQALSPGENDQSDEHHPPDREEVASSMHTRSAGFENMVKHLIAFAPGLSHSCSALAQKSTTASNSNIAGEPFSTIPEKSSLLRKASSSSPKAQKSLGSIIPRRSVSSSPARRLAQNRTVHPLTEDANTKKGEGPCARSVFSFANPVEKSEYFDKESVLKRRGSDSGISHHQSGTDAVDEGEITKRSEEQVLRSLESESTLVKQPPMSFDHGVDPSCSIDTTMSQVYSVQDSKSSVAPVNISSKSSEKCISLPPPVLDTTLTKNKSTIVGVNETSLSRSNDKARSPIPPDYDSASVQTKSPFAEGNEIAPRENSETSKTPTTSVDKSFELQTKSLDVSADGTVLLPRNSTTYVAGSKEIVQKTVSPGKKGINAKANVSASKTTLVDALSCSSEGSGEMRDDIDARATDTDRNGVVAKLADPYSSGLVERCVSSDSTSKGTITSGEDNGSIVSLAYSSTFDSLESMDHHKLAGCSIPVALNILENTCRWMDWGKPSSQRKGSDPPEADVSRQKKDIIPDRATNYEREEKHIRASGFVDELSRHVVQKRGSGTCASPPKLPEKQSSSSLATVKAPKSQTPRSAKSSKGQSRGRSKKKVEFDTKSCDSQTVLTPKYSNTTKSKKSAMKPSLKHPTFDERCVSPKLFKEQTLMDENDEDKAQYQLQTNQPMSPETGIAECEPSVDLKYSAQQSVGSKISHRASMDIEEVPQMVGEEVLGRKSLGRGYSPVDPIVVSTPKNTKRCSPVNLPENDPILVNRSLSLDSDGGTISASKDSHSVTESSCSSSLGGPEDISRKRSSAVEKSAFAALSEEQRIAALRLAERLRHRAATLKRRRKFRSSIPREP